MKLIRNSRGEKSWTVTLTLIPVSLINLKFLVSGMIFPYIGLQPVMSALEYATALGIAMAPLLVKEGVEKAAEAQVKAAAVTAGAKVSEDSVLAEAKVSEDAVLASAKVEERKS